MNSKCADTRSILDAIKIGPSPLPYKWSLPQMEKMNWEDIVNISPLIVEQAVSSMLLSDNMAQFNGFIFKIFEGKSTGNLPT